MLVPRVLTSFGKRSAVTLQHHQSRNLCTPMGGTTTWNSDRKPDFGGDGGSKSKGGGESMKSWQIHNYGGPSELQLNESDRIPVLNGPHEVLVKVLAASVNPIDLAMTNGYGADTINIMREFCPASSDPNSLLELPKKIANYFSPGTKKPIIEFPLTLGRDFAGVVTRVGQGLKSDVRVGDEVYGVVGVHRQGSHAEYVVACEDTIRRKPKNLNFVEAASIPYVGITTWAALSVTGNYCKQFAQKKFLVLGGSGGIGTFAVQYLKSQGAIVITTCSSDAVSLVTSLGPDRVIDYSQNDYKRNISSEAPFDCILHLSGPGNLESSLEQFSKHLKPKTGQFITLSPPFLKNIDKHGFVEGTAKNIMELITVNLKSITDAKAVTKWAFFIPSGEPLREHATLIENGMIKPVIHSVFSFADLPKAYQQLEQGHLRGKVVINMTN